MKYEGEYKEGKIWNGKGYDINGKLEFEVKNGNGKVKEYKKRWKIVIWRWIFKRGKKWKWKRI